MRILTTPETPEQFTTRIADLLRAPTTHVYFETSFLMWLTTVGTEARAEFVEWASALGDRTHVPLWSMHEYYRHHTIGTLRTDLVTRANDMMTAAKGFQREISKYSDQPLFVGQTAAAFQDSVSNVIKSLKDIADAATRWDYDKNAAAVVAWMNSRACETLTVFKSMATLSAEGGARFTQDLPPGFLDRTKEDTQAKGSNRYGDLLFWQEVVHHARDVKAASAVVLTRDRKADWFAVTREPDPALDWTRVKTRWLPVPSPHPTLAFEMKIEAQAELTLLDELYLGALLWKFGRPQYQRLAAAAIRVAPDHFDNVDPRPRPINVRARKRRESATIGRQDALAILNCALEPPSQRVVGFDGQTQPGRADSR